VRKLGLDLVELAEAILPFGFETTGDETVVRLVALHTDYDSLSMGQRISGWRG
jgi:hypothetical protein